eukprot:tig00020830_g14416.t1
MLQQGENGMEVVVPEGVERAMELESDEAGEPARSAPSLLAPGAPAPIVRKKRTGGGKSANRIRKHPPAYIQKRDGKLDRTFSLRLTLQLVFRLKSSRIEHIMEDPVQFDGKITLRELFNKQAIISCNVQQQRFERNTDKKNPTVGRILELKDGFTTTTLNELIVHHDLQAGDKIQALVKTAGYLSFSVYRVDDIRDLSEDGDGDGDEEAAAAAAAAAEAAPERRGAAGGTRRGRAGPGGARRGRGRRREESSEESSEEEEDEELTEADEEGEEGDGEESPGEEEEEEEEEEAPPPPAGRAGRPRRARRSPSRRPCRRRRRCRRCRPRPERERERERGRSHPRDPSDVRPAAFRFRALTPPPPTSSTEVAAVPAPPKSQAPLPPPEPSFLEASGPPPPPFPAGLPGTPPPPLFENVPFSPSTREAMDWVDAALDSPVHSSNSPSPDAGMAGWPAGPGPCPWPRAVAGPGGPLAAGLGAAAVRVRARARTPDSPMLATPPQATTPPPGGAYPVWNPPE